VGAWELCRGFITDCYHSVTFGAPILLRSCYQTRRVLVDQCLSVVLDLLHNKGDQMNEYEDFSGVCDGCDNEYGKCDCESPFDED
jgi:hypothetical protein